MADHSHTEAPVCPHCGAVERDAWEIDFGPGLDGDTVTNCGACGEDYFITRHTIVSYSTALIREKI